MKINISQIPEEGLNLQIEKDEAWFRQAMPAELGEHGISAAEITCRLQRVRETVYVEGEIKAELSAACGRCLEEIKLPLAGSFRYTLIPAPKEYAEESELSAEDMDSLYYEEEAVDLDPIIVEQVILQIPMKILCREDCKGLCPQCGANLNKGKCSCPEKPVDERLAVLKNLKLEN
ncbi:MAG: DUF177 domain-containing protein [Smithellaceae bacterium]|nr:DUF177 domain-containing protein [Smithellaceae bacterium]